MAFDAIMMVPNSVHKQSRPQDFQLPIERTCNHIDHICQMAGNANYVCIGTDLDGGYGTEQPPMDLAGHHHRSTIHAGATTHA